MFITFAETNNVKKSRGIARQQYFVGTLYRCIRSEKNARRKHLIEKVFFGKSIVVVVVVVVYTRFRHDI